MTDADQDVTESGQEVGSSGSTAPISIVRLPAHVRAPFEVYVNGVPQVEGRDYVIRARELRFNRRLAKDRISKWRWFVGAWGVGTYRQNDSVDVRYELDGRPMVAEALDIESATQQRSG